MIDSKDSIYRFISFASFINLIEVEKERYVDPSCWEDTYEAYFLRMIHEKENRPNIIRQFLTKLSPNNVLAVIGNYVKLYNAYMFCYGQCWTKYKETDAMWRIYSFENTSLRIETTTDCILDVLNNDVGQERYGIKYDEIQYDLDNAIEEDVIERHINWLSESKSTFEPLFHKRVAFKHEGEYRIIIYDKAMMNFISSIEINGTKANIAKNMNNKLNDLSIDDLVFEIDKELENMMMPKNDVKNKELLLNIPDISKYIKSVMSNPFIADWMDTLIARICEKRGILYLGKSQLYIR